MSHTKLFADDMKVTVYRVFRDTKEDVDEPQKDLTRLESFKQSFFIGLVNKWNNLPQEMLRRKI